jgi:hypothetical protein
MSENLHFQAVEHLKMAGHRSLQGNANKPAFPYLSQLAESPTAFCSPGTRLRCGRSDADPDFAPRKRKRPHKITLLHSILVSGDLHVIFLTWRPGEISAIDFVASGWLRERHPVLSRTLFQRIFSE